MALFQHVTGLHVTVSTVVQVVRQICGVHYCQNALRNVRTEFAESGDVCNLCFDWCVRWRCNFDRWISWYCNPNHSCNLVVQLEKLPSNSDGRRAKVFLKELEYLLITNFC